MSSFSSGFDEADAMFLELVEDLNNPRESYHWWVTIQAKRYVHANRRNLMSIAPGMEKLILPHNDKHVSMLNTFIEFRNDCHSHFKKYSDPEEARVNPPHILVECMKDRHYLCDHYMSRAFQNKMLELQFQSTTEGSQPLSGDKMCESVLGR
ncbi:gamma-aminobutyrate transaminase POP2 [Cucumis melo var. makuwa]|uniref:Gamma-aminobutyrate transaminase POP2 n=1 Tax=Cucumis melo var. makuwa TaxID=1194695 RepID=A0A5D3DMG7_CUCMM|nr:gamma-aminobutyrate transaminase POP2 [Cucumis melo var. makuwa]TYK24836.1 gamma-aminobutyrate transaminase POP2 [Cucumis melo var. makuwa]